MTSPDPASRPQPPGQGGQSGPGPQTEAWMERVTSWFMSQAGWPPIMGRTVAWLMVSDPPAQTPAQIAAAVKASRASLTTTLKLLTEARMVQATTRAGQRSTYYQITEDAWSGVLKRRLESMTSFVDITSEGLALFPDDSPQAGRVRAAHRLFAWLDSEADPLWKRWDTVNTVNTVNTADSADSADDAPEHAPRNTADPADAPET